MAQLGRKNQGRKGKRPMRNQYKVAVTPGNPKGKSINAIEKRLMKSPIWGDILDMLAIGTSVKDIVHFAKIEKNEYPTMQADTLERALHWFIEGRGKDYILHRCPSKLKMYESAMYEFDVFIAHKMLAAIQFERVTSAVDREKADGTKLDAATSKQIELLNTILKTVNDTEIQRNTRRISERFVRQIDDNNGSSVVMAVERVKEQYAQKWGEKTAKAILDPESRRRLLNVIEKVRSTSSSTMKKILEAKVIDGDVIDATPTISDQQQQ